MPRGFFVANCTWCKGFAVLGAMGSQAGGVGKTGLLVGTTQRVVQVMVAGAGPGTAGGRVLRSGTSVCCGVRVAAREQGEVVGGGSGHICGIKSEENVSASLFYPPMVSSQAVGSPSASSPHWGVPGLSF